MPPAPAQFDHEALVGEGRRLHCRPGKAKDPVECCGKPHELINERPATGLNPGRRRHAGKRTSRGNPGCRLKPGGRFGPVDVRLTIHGNRETVVRTIESLFLAVPRVRRLPDDRILVVGNTCVWRSSGPDRNAVVYDEHGHLDAEETWGDDIFHLAVAGDGTVWVGYGSMAILGTSDGWGDPGPAPLGSRGVIRYEPDAIQPIWHYPQGSAWGNIDDCYALNIAGDGTWICYYRNFPIVRITDRGLTGWHNDQVKGAKALAVNDPYIALYGGYNADADVLTVGTLTGGRLEITHQYRVVMPDGTPVEQPTMIGRGPTLHTVIGNDWLQLALTDMMARPTSFL